MTNSIITDGVLNAIPAEMKKAYHADQSAEKAFVKKRGAFIDLCYSLDIRSTMLQSPKTGGMITEEAFEELNAMIVGEFPANEQKLLAMPAKAVPEGRKDVRKQLQQKIGSKRKDLKNALKRREELHAQGKGADTIRTRTSEEILANSLTDALKRVQTLEEPTFDIEAFVEHIEAAQEVMKRGL